MFNDVFNKAKCSLSQKLTEDIDGALNGFNADSINEFMKENIIKSEDCISKVYEDKIKLFLQDNAEHLKKEIMKELRVVILSNELTRSIVVSIVSKVIYDSLPEQIKFCIGQKTFISFVGMNFETILDTIGLVLTLSDTATIFLI